VRRTFVYKRTHQGDPDSQGWFGNEDCMGSLRSCDFDAVIGIGGICDLAKAEGIGRKLNWIGIGARKQRTYKRGPLITFDHFVLFEENGKDFETIAPALSGRLLITNGARFLFSDDFNEIERKEVNCILKLAETAPPSAKRYAWHEGTNCPSGCKVDPIPCMASRRRKSCASRPTCLRK
jgi:hypothetical protein